MIPLRLASVSLAWLIVMPLAALASEDAAAVASSKAEAPPRLDLRPEQYADDAGAAQTADELERRYPADSRPEAVRMLIDILRGSQMGPNEGWFGPAQTRYTWRWLAEQHALPVDRESMSRGEFRGTDLQWDRLDRDGDGSITPGDLDWSDRNPWVQQAYLVGRIFRRLNAGGNGRLTREELNAFFDRVGEGRDYVTLDSLRDALLGGSGGGDGPDRETLVRGLLGNEIGSIHEGPRVGDVAPDFALATPDGQATYQLSKLVGQKPVVLCFGNFTCGPFRAFYPEVDAVYERHKDAATFLMVYVREAHPNDGWQMESNTQAGVAVAQPQSLAERAAVCDQFCQRLRPAIPVVVDEIADTAGNAYSGMPARLYVIDRAGRVAYKSGRGPFGFKVGEMEQALAMALLEGNVQNDSE